MAKIPLGNFGNQIARPAGQVNINPAAFTGGADAIRQAADRVNALLTEKQNEDLRQQQMLDRAKAANAVLDREIQVDAIHGEISQQIADGTIHYDAAKDAYKKRIESLGMPDIKGLDPVTAENLDKGFKRVQFKGENAIEGLVIKSRAADFKSQADGIMDKLGKQAGLPSSDMTKLSTQLDSMDEIGRQAYGAAWEKRKQDWKDNSWDAKLNQQAMGVRDSLDGIKTLQNEITQGAYSDKLDSNRRNSLVAKLDGYKTSLIQRQEAAAARAERHQEMTFRKAEASFKAFESMQYAGPVSPAEVDRVLKETAGTPFAAATNAVFKNAQEYGALATQSIDKQRAALRAIDQQIATHGQTRELVEKRDKVQKVVEQSESDYKSRGIEAGVRRGVISGLSPIDISTPESFASSIASRVSEAESVSVAAKQPVSPLTNDEAAGIRSMLEALPPKQRSQAVATIADSVGSRSAVAIAAQLDKQDKALSLAFATSSSKTTAGRYTSELILKGATAIKDGTAMKDDKKVTGWKATIASEIDGAFPDERAATAVKESAYYIAAGLAAENGGAIGSSDIKRAVTLAVGGSIIERNGKRLPIPAEMEADDFEKRIKSISPNDIIKQAPGGTVRIGGAEMNAQEFAASVPGQELMYAGPGRYAVIVKGRPVTNAASKPIIIGVQ